MGTLLSICKRDEQGRVSEGERDGERKRKEVERAIETHLDASTTAATSSRSSSMSFLLGFSESFLFRQRKTRKSHERVSSSPSLLFFPQTSPSTRTTHLQLSNLLILGIHSFKLQLVLHLFLLLLLLRNKVDLIPVPRAFGPWFDVGVDVDGRLGPSKRTRTGWC